MLPCHVMKIIPLGDHCQEIAGVGHQAPSCTGWSRHVDAFVLRRSPPYSYELNPEGATKLLVEFLVMAL